MAIAAGRIADAKALHAALRHDGAVYLCGYALEIALKARVCRVLNWNGFPSTGSEFQNLQSFKTHNLDALLRLSGSEAFVKQNFLAEWSIAAQWDPEIRYQQIGQATPTDAQDMISAVEKLVQAL